MPSLAINIFLKIELAYLLYILAQRSGLAHVFSRDYRRLNYVFVTAVLFDICFIQTLCNILFYTKKRIGSFVAQVNLITPFIMAHSLLLLKACPYFHS